MFALLPDVNRFLLPPAKYCIVCAKVSANSALCIQLVFNHVLGLVTRLEFPKHGWLKFQVFL